MSSEKKIEYKYDPKKYWNSDEEYNDRNKTYGHFTEDGSGYVIEDINTPKDWLNFICNDKVTVSTNARGQGFLSYKLLRLHVTRYSNNADYVPRCFTEGRDFTLIDRKSGKRYELFRNNKRMKCLHALQYSLITETIENDLRAELKLYVPASDPVECLEITVTDLSDKNRSFELEAKQFWSFLYASKTASIIRDITHNDICACKNGFIFDVEKRIGIDSPLLSYFVSPQFSSAKEVYWGEGENPDVTLILGPVDIKAGGNCVFHTAVGVCEGEDYHKDANLFIDKYTRDDTFAKEFESSVAESKRLINAITCSLPDKTLENFLNYWFKHQTHLTFYNTRGSITGYRDVLQDTWGYSLLSTSEARRVILRTLGYMQKDGVCPRQYDMISHHHDMSEYMDSGSWIHMPLTAYIKETGDFDILNEEIGYIDSDKKSSVLDHVLSALDMLYKKRGQHGCCLAGDGDWNDALGGLKQSVGAESVWLTMALVWAQNDLAELFDRIGRNDLADKLRYRSEELKDNINRYAWDGDWYVYAFFGDGTPIGSHKNKEGIIHLNAQTWAMFAGIADSEKKKKMYAAISKYLDTPIGPMMLFPPYIEENVGRIVFLRPGTFENASVYQHAVAFKVMADAANGDRNLAYRTFKNILPVSDVTYDNRRASEPYCTGNFYNGITSPRFGQNYYGWFTGNAAWFMKIGYEQICGVSADYDGIRIENTAPDEWNSWKVEKNYRGCRYIIEFKRAEGTDEKGIYVDGKKISGNIIPVLSLYRCVVKVIL